jgi:glycolate oxidase iron-sulfur subunit
VLVAAAGCGHTLKQYGQILETTTGDAPAAGFAAPVRDVQEFLGELGLGDAFSAGLQPLRHPDGTQATADRPLPVAYHDACHALHGQGIGAQPRALLRQIPHVVIREASEAGVCCGSAGIYNLVQPQEADALGELKANDLSHTGAAVVASANIGCSLQIRKHLQRSGHPQTVAHPLQLLAESAGLTASPSDGPG